jgi:foldase protein PrsA
MTNRCLTVLTAGAVTLAGLAGCGGSSSSAQIVAQVTGVGTISRATLDHWTPVEAAVIYSEQPTEPTPKGVMPDPPGYSACVAFLKKSARPTVGSSGSQTAADLKRQCAHQYEELKQITLNTLVGWYWIIGEGTALGIKVSEAEAKQRLETVNSRLFAKPADFANYLKWTGQAVADMVFRSRVQLFEVKLQERLLQASRQLPKSLTPQQRQKALAQLSEGLSPARQWVPRTSCRSGYVASVCRQYRGPLAPGLPN